MKKAVFLFVIFCSAITTFAEISLGIMTYTNYWANSTQAKSFNSGTTITTGTSVILGPALRLVLTNDLELTPELGVNVDNEDWGGIVGCGLYFHFINLEHFSFSLGPKLSSSFYFTKTDASFGIGLPLNFDFNINRTLGLRLSVVSAGWSYRYWEDNTYKHMDNGFILSYLTSPMATMFITF
jgi:hypothetical protein